MLGESDARLNYISLTSAVQTAQAYYRVGLLQNGLSDNSAASRAFVEAIERFDRLTQIEPKDPDHWRQLAQTYYSLAETTPEWDITRARIVSARDACSNAIRLRSKDAQLFAARAQYH